MPASLSEILREITHAQSVELGEVLQTLWSGYGVIQRATLRGLHGAGKATPTPVVIKHVDVSRARPNRRGWSGDASHDRKVRSYKVEVEFYRSHAGQCTHACHVPNFIAAHQLPDASGWVLVLSDLDAEGFSDRKTRAARRDIHACLKWLAEFHALFLQQPTAGLWPVGTYWHLETRRGEFDAMADGPLKHAAQAIDRRLNNATYQTLVHGDAKLANFCFSDRAPDRVAAVDFQYVGRGCGMKDVAYFISSCLYEDDAESQHETLLDYYFDRLEEAVTTHNIEIDFVALHAEWQALYPFAWADFCRFLQGWDPGHWKLNSYSDRMTQTVLAELNHG